MLSLGNLGSGLQKVKDQYVDLQSEVTKKNEILNDKKTLLSFLELTSSFKIWVAEQDIKVMKALDGSSDKNDSMKIFSEYITKVETGEKKMHDIADAAEALVKAEHRDVSTIEKNYKETATAWNKLIRLKNQRDQRLSELLQTKKFDNQCSEVNLWMLEMVAKLRSTEIGSTRKEIEILLVEHDRRLREIDVMQDSVS